MKNVLYVLLGLMAGFALAGLLFFISRAPAGQPILLQPAPTKAPIAVHVLGAVPRPGLYEFAEGSRIQSAVDAAGGLLTDADSDKLNLAALLEDGQQLTIPYKDGAGPAVTGDGEIPPDGELPSDYVDPGLLQDYGVELININTASVEELDAALPGVGNGIAQKIIDYREQNNGFYAIEEIANIPGIGEPGSPTYEAIINLITVGD